MPRKDQDEYNEYMRKYMKQRYTRRRKEAIEMLGGECIECGSKKELQFDHINAEEKAHNMAKILASGSEAKVSAELEKCQVLCEDCHLEKSRDQNDWANRRFGALECVCGQNFKDRMAYAGHKRWCKEGR